MRAHLAGLFAWFMKLPGPQDIYTCCPCCLPCCGWGLLMIHCFVSFSMLLQSPLFIYLPWLYLEQHPGLLTQSLFESILLTRQLSVSQPGCPAHDGSDIFTARRKVSAPVRTHSRSSTDVAGQWFNLLGLMAFADSHQCEVRTVLKSVLGISILPSFE